MKTIYCISGLGADERAFSKLKIDGHTLQVIKWLMPEPKETLQQYAERMRAGIKEEYPILMGLSFGGMVCTEIAKQIPVKKIILISSIKSSKELPWWMKMVAALKLNKIVPLKSTKLTQPIQNRMLGVQSEEEKTLVAGFRREVDLPYTTWAVNQAINWKNEWQHPNICHIHGDNDHMFPIKNIKPTFTIKKRRTLYGHEPCSRSEYLYQCCIGGELSYQCFSLNIFIPTDCQPEPVEGGLNRNRYTPASTSSA